MPSTIVYQRRIPTPPSPQPYWGVIAENRMGYPVLVTDNNKYILVRAGKDMYRAEVFEDLMGKTVMVSAIIPNPNKSVMVVSAIKEK